MENRRGATGTSAYGAWLALVSCLQRDTTELTEQGGGGAATGNNPCKKAPQLGDDTGTASWTPQLAKTGTLGCDTRNTK